MELPKERFHSSISYYFDNYRHSPGSLALLCIASVLFGLSATVSDPGDPKDPTLNIFLAIFGACALLASLLPASLDYEIPETLGTAGQLSLYAAVVQDRPSPDAGSWDAVARAVNKHVREHGLTRTGYLFYDGEECRVQFERMMQRHETYRGQVAGWKARCKVARRNAAGREETYVRYGYVDSAAQTEGHRSEKPRVVGTDRCGKPMFDKPQGPAPAGPVGRPPNLDSMYAMPTRPRDPVQNAKSPVDNSALKEAFKKASHVYKKSSKAYWNKVYPDLGLGGGKSKKHAKSKSKTKYA
ncbi:hypothetical protein DAKH74_029880 [Maudiozyma humilis]|uniref:Uncharacterized protein n=1 Tax=Maudiozyma humilis TaxID=51915 RepID=A0AAV5RYC2_MAUHU|nr:hypothetical protein DAKH74_029880 [Kazachstania humilis]